MKIRSKSLHRYCQYFIDKYNRCKIKKHMLCNHEIITFLEKYIMDNNIKNILDIESSNLCNLYKMLHKHDDVNYMGTYMVDSTKLIKRNNVSYCNLNLLRKDDFKKYDLILVKNYFEYLSEESIRTFINDLKISKKPVFIITKTAFINIDTKDGLFKPINLNIEPFNMDLNKKLEYYNKEEVVVYISVLLFFMYLTYNKSYKLYIFITILIILYGCIFPKYTIYNLH